MNSNTEYGARFKNALIEAVPEGKRADLRHAFADMERPGSVIPPSTEEYIEVAMQFGYVPEQP